jgi:hypothetical protein
MIFWLILVLTLVYIWKLSLPGMRSVPAIDKRILQLTYYHRLFRSKKVHEIFSRTRAKKIPKMLADLETMVSNHPDDDNKQRTAQCSAFL